MSTLARTQNVPTPQPSEDEDQVIFKTPSDGSKRNSGAPSKRSSLIINNSQNSFSPSPLSLMGGESNGNQYHGHNRTESLDADIMPSFASLRLSSEPEPESSLGVNGISNGTQSSVLAPAAEIDEDGGRSRHSSGGTSSSNMDSPAIPTPAQQSKNGNVITGDRGRKFPQQGFQNGYGNQYGMDDGGINGFTNGIGMPQGAMGSFQPLLSPVMSPVMNGLHGVPSFSPPITSQYNPGDMNGSYGGVRPEDFNGNWSMQNMQNRINAQRNGPLPGGRSVQANGVNPSAAGSATFPTLNGAQQNNVNANAASLAFQQYAAQAAQGNYPAGMMSPTMTSPTFQAHQVYSPIQGPFSPYALPPPLQGGNPMYDMMSPTMSPRAGSGAVPSMTAGRGQTAQQGQRGHGYSASNPANGRDASQANGARSPVQQRNQNGQVTQQGVAQGQRGLQSPRGPGAINVGAAMTLGNHAMNQGPYSPPLAATGYGPMSPPFGGFYPQTQGISPEVLQAMAMAPYMQTTLNGIQQDPSLMALLQQGGGPSANNRKLGLYKTELCRSWEEKGSCKYGEKCQFAHGDTEQRRVERHPKYKTEICRTFWVSGSCPYGKRCCFIHTELPANGLAPGQAGEGQRNGGGRDGMQQNDRNQGSGDGRARSMSTNSDPNDQPSSLLARISARAQANNMNANGGSNNNVPAPSSINRSSDGSPVNGGIPESVIADAIARAYSAYGMPAGQQAASGTAPPRRDVTPPETHSAQATTPSLSGFATRNNSAPSNGIGGGHHRVSASVDFGRHGRGLGSELSSGLTGGGGHHRNPSASSIMPSYSIPGLSRTPISGQSSPFGNEATTPNRSVAVGSSLLDPSPW